MKFLKGLALSLLGFLLFLSLSVFGLAFMLNQTVLNPKFITTEFDRLDISSLIQEMLVEVPPDIKPLVTDTLTKAEPLLEEQVDAALFSTYDYLLGKKPSPELTQTLRDTLLSKEFVVSLLDKVDISSLVSQSLKEKLTEAIPTEAGFLTNYLDDIVDDVIPALVPLVKEQVIASADPILDYIVGKRQSFSVSISLAPMKTILGDKLKEAILKSPPPELAALPPALIEQQFDQLYPVFSAQLPSTFELNETVLGRDLPNNVTKAIAEVEKVLIQGRQYIGYFQTLYLASIGLILLSILGIVLIHRQVRGASRELGTTFTSYGALEFGGIFIGNYLADKYLVMPDIPPSLNEWVLQFSKNLLNPLMMFSLVVLIVGIALLIVSFVYPRQPSPE